MPQRSRREFLTEAGGAMAGLLTVTGKGVTSMHADGSVVILQDSADPIASTVPVRWAIRQVEEAFAARGVPVHRVDRLEQAPSTGVCLLVAGGAAPEARALLDGAGLSLPAAPESLALARGKAGNRTALLACGSDARGLVYALLEVADRADCAREPLSALDIRRPLIARPANPLRSVARFFTSDVEDMPWFTDRAFWQRYLSLLAAQRFNRFSLTFGIGYDFLKEVRDSYFHFAYPFLVAVPGYAVRAVGLPDAERARNLEMLRFISEETASRGLHFQLGLWTHGYDWAANPDVNYTIEGLTSENHAVYCRDALQTLLQACPAIQGVTFRIHGESGVPEGTYAFWKTVFEGVVRCGRRVEIDMHAKGIDQAMIDIALATGMPVNVSPKFWAEHLGLPYHQAAIRALEMPPTDRPDQGFFAKSDGSRRFLRYGYGDLLAEDRRYGVLHRIWPGTQRLLLWGDPTFAAAYGRAAGFCGSLGMELCEPLSFKGRKGSGQRGGRDAYADTALKPAGGDFEKYRYGYRLWGRLLYSPDSDPEAWRRFLRTEFGEGAKETEAALAQASRILPLITTAHLPSAANNGFWPEIYTNMPLVDEKRPHPYSDTPSPKRFGMVSPLDPAQFSPIEEFAQELLEGEPSGRYSPLETARWLEALANGAARHLAGAETQVSDRNAPAFRRLAADVALQSGLGRFFAEKLRAGALYALYERSGEPTALQAALSAYRTARAAWVELIAKTRGVYTSDITFGRAAHLRGHWSDRLAAIDQDIADMERRGEQATAQTLTPTLTPEARKRVEQAVHTAPARPQRPPVPCAHIPPPPFRRGEPIMIEATFRQARGRTSLASARLRYRRVNQGEPYREVEMERQGDRCRATLPGDATDSPYPLQYFFALRDARGRAWLYPGLNADLANQPYFVVRQARG
jgi:hypothetical protein